MSSRPMATRSSSRASSTGMTARLPCIIGGFGTNDAAFPAPSTPLGPFFKSSLSQSPSLPDSSLSSLYLLYGSSITNLLPQSSSSQIQLSCPSCCISSPARTRPASWSSTARPTQFPRQTTMKTHPKSLVSPSVRTVRKTHLRNRPQTGKRLSIPGEMRDRGLMKEYRHLRLHVSLIARMSAVLGLVHTILTRAIGSPTFLGTRMRKIAATSIPKYPEFSPR